MSKIKAYISMDERSKAHYYQMFDLVSELPEIENVEELNDPGLTIY